MSWPEWVIQGVCYLGSPSRIHIHRPCAPTVGPAFCGPLSSLTPHTLSATQIWTRAGTRRRSRYAESSRSFIQIWMLCMEEELLCWQLHFPEFRDFLIDRPRQRTWPLTCRLQRCISSLCSVFWPNDEDILSPRAHSLDLFSWKHNQPWICVSEEYSIGNEWRSGRENSRYYL